MHTVKPLDLRQYLRPHDLPLIVTLKSNSIIGDWGARRRVVCELGKARNPSAAGTPRDVQFRGGGPGSSTAHLRAIPERVKKAIFLRLEQLK